MVTILYTWNSNLTQEDVLDIERVQKSFLHIALGNMYVNYESALDKMNLETLKKRSICLKFAAKKASEHRKHGKWFIQTDPLKPDTRSLKTDFKPPLCRLQRFAKSPIPYLTNLLNNRETSK
jgi:hypothetical protein